MHRYKFYTLSTNPRCNIDYKTHRLYVTKNNNLKQLMIVKINEKKPILKRQNFTKRSEKHRKIKGVE